MAAGDTTVTVASDESEVMSVAVAYIWCNVNLSFTEFSEGDDTVVSLSYTEVL